MSDEKQDPSMLMDRKQVANAYRCSVPTSYRWQREGLIPQPDFHLGNHPRWRRQTIERDILERSTGIAIKAHESAGEHSTEWSMIPPGDKTEWTPTDDNKARVYKWTSENNWEYPKK